MCQPTEVTTIKHNSNDSSSQSEPTNQIETRRSSKVQFGLVEIRKYNKILGDNPACSAGPPTQLDWTYASLPSKTLDEYETNRLPRRTRRHLALTPTTRRNSMYYHFGYSHEEIDKASEGIKRIKKNRVITKSLKSNGHMEKTQEVVQNVTRRIKRTFSKEKIYNKADWDAYAYNNQNQNRDRSGSLSLHEQQLGHSNNCMVAVAVR